MPTGKPSRSQLGRDERHQAIAELRARVAELELSNYLLDRQVEELVEELAASAARARHAARAGARTPVVEPAGVT